jgi:hypothetical protein
MAGTSRDQQLASDILPIADNNPDSYFEFSESKKKVVAV